MLKSKYILLVMVIACFFAACQTDPAYNKDTQLAIDRDLIKTYIKVNNIPAQDAGDGLYYQIVKPGAAGNQAKYLPTDTILLRYVASTIKGQLFDSTTTLVDSLATRFVFSSAIQGWQEGLPLIQPGGVIRLIVPSTMAYQNRVISAMSTINGVNAFLPANSILDFNIRLISVKNYKPPIIVQ